MHRASPAIDTTARLYFLYRRVSELPAWDRLALGECKQELARTKKNASAAAAANSAK